MDTFFRRGAGVTVAAAALALVLVLGGTGQAKNDKKEFADFYAASEWMPGNSEVGYRGQLIGSRDCFEASSAEGEEWFAIPIDVPDGAEITKVTFYYLDSEPDEQLRFHVGFHTVGFGDPFEEFPEATSVTVDRSGGDPDTNPADVMQSVDVTPTSPVVVDNTDRRYVVAAGFSACGTFTPDPDDTTWLLLDGVRVHYTLK